MPSRVVIATNKAPRPIGQFSQGIRVGNLVFLSGQVALDSQTGRLVGNTIEAQTHQALENARSVLEAAGSDLEHVVKVTVYLTSMCDMPRMNAVYGEYFVRDPPARSTVQVAALPLGALVEIECWAVDDQS